MLTALLLLLASPTTEGPAKECPEFQIFSATPRAGTLSFLLIPNTEGATYNWVVSAGTIVNGQGTTTIEVEADVGTFVTASVEVWGLSEECDSFFSASDEVLE